jgi:hypothetical protein
MNVENIVVTYKKKPHTKTKKSYLSLIEHIADSIFFLKKKNDKNLRQKILGVLPKQIRTYLWAYAITIQIQYTGSIKDNRI